jgi:hypothetical protein
MAGCLSVVGTHDCTEPPRNCEAIRISGSASDHGLFRACCTSTGPDAAKKSSGHPRLVIRILRRCDRRARGIGASLQPRPLLHGAATRTHVCAVENTRTAADSATTVLSATCPESDQGPAVQDCERNGCASTHSRPITTEWEARCVARAGRRDPPAHRAVQASDLRFGQG